MLPTTTQFSQQPECLSVCAVSTFSSTVIKPAQTILDLPFYLLYKVLVSGHTCSLSRVPIRQLEFVTTTNVTKCVAINLWMLRITFEGLTKIQPEGKENVLKILPFYGNPRV